MVALNIVQAAVGVAGLFGSKSGAAEKERAQLEMLMAMQRQLKAIGEGIEKILENVEELRNLIVNVPEETVREIQEGQVLQAQDYFMRWIEHHQRRISERGIEYAFKYAELDELEDEVIDFARRAGTSLIRERDYVRIPIIALAAFLELTGGAYVSVELDAEAYAERMRVRSSAALAYRDWFKAIIADEGDESLSAAIAKVLAERSPLASVEEQPSEFEMYIVSSSQLPFPNRNSGLRGPSEEFPYICGFVTGDEHNAPRYHVGHQLFVQEVVARREWETFSGEEGVALKAAMKALVEMGYLRLQDAPRPLKTSYVLSGVPIKTIICATGPNQGQPVGGPAKAWELWSAGETSQASLDQRLKERDEAETELSVRTGLQLIALAHLRKLADETLEWLDGIERTTAEMFA
jgi:hypothetical protein